MGRAPAGTIRETVNGDRDAVLALYPLAFPGEELRPLVRALIGGEAETLSLAAFANGAPIAHILFTLFARGRGALLGPLAVSPAHQRRGLGSALVEAGLERLTARGVARAFVLGDPAYYGRFGFRPEERVEGPYPLPPEWREAWRSRALGEGAPLPPGPCALPAPWMDPAYWSP